jgi:hypothetical protein
MGVLSSTSWFIINLFFIYLLFFVVVSRKSTTKCTVRKHGQGTKAGRVGVGSYKCLAAYDRRSRGRMEHGVAILMDSKTYIQFYLLTYGVELPIM